jgi:DNA-directed RNA polymerase subunit RPC12/RpoP
MIQCQCTNCNAWLEIPDQYRGTTGRCKQCGGIILVPEEPVRPPAAAKAKARKRADPEEKKRLAVLVGALAAVLVVLAALSFWREADGSPLALTLFSINFATGVAAAAAFLVDLHTPDIVADRLRMPLTRLISAVVFIPASVFAFFLAWLTYCP